MILNFLITVGLCLFCHSIPLTLGIVVTELGLKQFEPRSSLLSLPSEQQNVSSYSSYMFEVKIQSKDEVLQTWEFLIHSEFKTGRKNTLHFPEFLPPSGRNPLVFCASFTQMSTARLIVIVQNHPSDLNSTEQIALFDEELRPPNSISQKFDSAPLQQIILKDSGSRLITFIRWYCASGYSGDHCESQCIEDSCVHEDKFNSVRNLQDFTNPSDQLKIPFWVPPLGAADCPCDPCLLVNVAGKERINGTVLQTSLNVLLFLRTTADMQDSQPEIWPIVEKPPRAYAQLKLEDVRWTGDRHLVAVCVHTDEKLGSTVPPQTIRKALVDLTVSGWISEAIDLENKQGQLFGPRSSNDLMQEIVNFVQRYNQVVLNCDAVRSARSSLLTGFWIMLCLAVIMSVVTSYLIYEQHQQQNGLRARKSDRRKLPKSLNLLQPLSDDITVREERSVAVGGNPC
ncbi:hypothetical protein D915_000611 [Fasciola hepatica]|uniref:Uncharacterized protein n=1 Tax=Fasciola hepatica TaxID=6192 RepID=A0A4E0RL11_FASHE|nr:hypothetical protein D915_000611 [Fasciola hepatica]